MSTYNFSMTSRYFGNATATMTDAAGDTVSYLTRRFLPAPEQFSLLQLYKVKQDDRLDNITAAVMGDPQLFWRLADANRAMDLTHLTKPVGRTLRITLPQGVPGTTNA